VKKTPPCSVLVGLSPAEPQQDVVAQLIGAHIGPGGVPPPTTRLTQYGDDEEELPPLPAGLWLADTGCAYDLISQSGSGSLQKRSAQPLTFNTAGGQTTAYEVAPAFCSELGRAVEPLVLNDSPWVLSIGRRCIDEGFTFVWIGKSNPLFISPEGVRTELVVEDYIPYLAVGGPSAHTASPAVTSSVIPRPSLPTACPAPGVGPNGEGDEVDGEEVKEESSQVGEEDELEGAADDEAEGSDGGLAPHHDPEAEADVAPDGEAPAPVPDEEGAEGEAGGDEEAGGEGGEGEGEESVER